MGTATSSDRETDPASTESLIRSVMVEQKRTRSRDRLPELEPVEEEVTMRGPLTYVNRVVKPQRSTGEASGLKARILAYRPTRKHILIAAFVLIMVMRPWLIPGLLFIAFWVGLIIWLTLGPDRVTEWAQSAWERLNRRKPELADRLRQRADAFALRFDALLDKLPDSWAEKLALPDMSNPVANGETLEERPDPFDRLKLPEVYRG